MQAVLEDGIRTFLRHCPATSVRARRLWQEEFDWLTSHDESHPFTFERICEALGIEPRGMRARILANGARQAEPPDAHSLTAPRGTIPYRCSMR